MFRFCLAVLFSVLLSFPCLANVSAEDFARMDLNGDGVVSQEEFMQKMNISEEELKKNVAEAMSSGQRQEIIDETIVESKKLLPLKVDQATTWTDIYGKGDELHYIYRVDMDTELVPSQGMAEMRSVFETMVCQKMKPMICGVAKNTLLVNGINIMTHFNDNGGKLLGECRISLSDCL